MFNERWFNACLSSGQFGRWPLPGEIFIIYFCHGIRLHVNEGTVFQKSSFMTTAKSKATINYLGASGTNEVSLLCYYVAIDCVTKMNITTFSLRVRSRYCVPCTWHACVSQLEGGFFFFLLRKHHEHPSENEMIDRKKPQLFLVNIKLVN